MIAESTRPATVDDLEILDDRRYRVLWAGGTPWGCMVFAPAGVTGLVAMLAVPFALTWSCYEGGEAHCGRCGTCVERREAFATAGVSDPTQYAALE